MEHTKAPWAYNSEDQIIHLPNDFSKMIAQVRGWGWIQKLPNPEKIQDANGRLMAASPDLFEVCEEMLKAFTDAPPDWLMTKEVQVCALRMNELLNMVTGTELEIKK